MRKRIKKGQNNLRQIFTLYFLIILNNALGLAYNINIFLLFIRPRKQQKIKNILKPKIIKQIKKTKNLNFYSKNPQNTKNARLQPRRPPELNAASHSTSCLRKGVLDSLGWKSGF